MLLFLYLLLRSPLSIQSIFPTGWVGSGRRVSAWVLYSANRWPLSLGGGNFCLFSGLWNSVTTIGFFWGRDNSNLCAVPVDSNKLWENNRFPFGLKDKDGQFFGRRWWFRPESLSPFFRLTCGQPNAPVWKYPIYFWREEKGVVVHRPSLKSQSQKGTLLLLDCPPPKSLGSKELNVRNKLVERIIFFCVSFFVLVLLEQMIFG